MPTLRHLLVAIVVTLCVSRSTVNAQASSTPPLQRLDILLGVWEVDDVFRTRSGAEIREVGTRTCAMAMRNSYVECITHGRNAAGVEREYRWYIRWNATAARYELLGLFSNTPLKLLQTFRIDSTGMTWNIRSPSSTDDSGVEQWSGAQLVFSSRDRAVWTSYRNLDTMPVTEWQQATRETWVRRR